jgi:hypothetical protein
VLVLGDLQHVGGQGIGKEFLPGDIVVRHIFNLFLQVGGYFFGNIGIKVCSPGLLGKVGDEFSACGWIDMIGFVVYVDLIPGNFGTGSRPRLDTGSSLLHLHTQGRGVPRRSCP